MNSINNDSIQNGNGISSSSVRNRVTDTDTMDQSSSKFHYYSSSDQHNSKPKGIFGGSSQRPQRVDVQGDNVEEAKSKMGTLDGVLLPTLQTILGVILFLRLPSITAQAGCVYTTVIILICVTSTLITAISLSAIATNGTIQAGGPYYVISRTLGLEVGGALGLLYYLGTTMACAMSILGGVEAILRSLGDSIENQSQAMLENSEPNELNPFVPDQVGLGERYLLAQYDISNGDPLTMGALGNKAEVFENMESEIEMEIDHQYENSILVQLGTQYLSLIMAMAVTVFVSVGFRVVDMAANLFLAIMFLSIFCAVLGCILFASGQYLGDLIPWDRMYMDNVWPHYTPDPTTGIEPNFFSLLALFYPSVTGKFDKLHCREISFGISLIILIT